MRRVQAYRNIPPHHPEATKAQDAYRLEELVPEGLWNSLETGRLYNGIADEQYRKDVLEGRYKVSPATTLGMSD
jgi:hypothetical protein